MRRVTCDQNEFDPPDSEQSLEISIAAPSHHCPDLPSLLAASGASARSGPHPPPGWHRWPVVAEHLSRFAGVDLTHPNLLRDAVLLQDEWDNVELGIAIGSVLVWYHWFTTA